MTTWTDVTAEADLFEGAGIAAEPVGHDIALFSIDAWVFASDNLCTRGHARLCDGYIEGHDIECPIHQGKFDVHTGAPTCGPATDPLRLWPVKIEAGRVYLQL